MEIIRTLFSVCILMITLFLKCESFSIIHSTNSEIDTHWVTFKTADEIDKKQVEWTPKSKPRFAPLTFRPTSDSDLPDEIDWRQKGFVTDVKNQGECGSSWIFSVTGSLEGQQKKKSGVLVALSEQQLIDCPKNGTIGCSGGLTFDAFEYIKENGGIDTEASYPFEGTKGPCRFSKTNVGAIVTGSVVLPLGSEEALKKAVATVGPVSVVVDASQPSFQLYVNGIYDEKDCSSTELNHALLVVGYGRESGQDYWLLKNSWGPSWGMEGYIKMARNKNNQCGIASYATYPLV